MKKLYLMIISAILSFSIFLCLLINNKLHRKDGDLAITSFDGIASNKNRGPTLKSHRNQTSKASEATLQIISEDISLMKKWIPDLSNNQESEILLKLSSIRSGYLKIGEEEKVLRSVLTASQYELWTKAVATRTAQEAERYAEFRIDEIKSSIPDLNNEQILNIKNSLIREFPADKDEEILQLFLTSSQLAVYKNSLHSIEIE